MFFLKIDQLPVFTSYLFVIGQFVLKEQRGHLSAHASDGQCVEYANCEILAKLKIELSVTAISSDSRPPKFEMLDINNCF